MVLFPKMTLGVVWPSRFGGHSAASLPLAPPRAAAKPTTAASAGRRSDDIVSMSVNVPIVPVNGPSMKMAKGEAASMVTEAVLGEQNLLSIVIKYSILSDPHAPKLANVARIWNEQLIWWKEQFALMTPVGEELKGGVLCFSNSPTMALLHGWGAAPRDLLLGLQQPVIPDAASWQNFWALGERTFADRRMLHEDALTLLDLPGGKHGWLTGGVIDAYFGSFLHDIRRTEPYRDWQRRIREAQPNRVYLPNYLSAIIHDGPYHQRALIGYSDMCPHVKRTLLDAKFIDGTLNLGPNLHWVYYTLDMERKIIYLFDPASIATEQHGVEVLTMMRDMVNDDVAPFGNDDLWHVRVVTPADGLPCQVDGNSCGVYAALIGEHVATGRTIPSIDLASIREQRAHMLTVLLEGGAGV